MSAGKVDVLAVMDRARDVLAEIYAKHQLKIGPFASQAQKSNGELRQARAAVAELIAAAREGAAECAYFAPAYDHAEKTRDRLRAALAKIEAKP